MEGFLATIMDIVLMMALVLMIEQIKKLQKPETVAKLKEKKFYLILFIVLCLPLAVIVCMKNGVFDNNTTISIIGIVIRTFFIMSTFGTAFYDTIKKYIDKKKEEIDE